MKNLSYTVLAGRSSLLRPRKSDTNCTASVRTFTLDPWDLDRSNSNAVISSTPYSNPMMYGRDSHSLVPEVLHGIRPSPVTTAAPHTAAAEVRARRSVIPRGWRADPVKTLVLQRPRAPAQVLHRRDAPLAEV